MVWYNLNVNGSNIKFTSLKADSVEYPSVDKDGNELEKHYIDANGNRTSNAYNSYKWIRKSDGQEVPKAYKLINSKVADKLKKTKEVTAEIVDVSETNDLMTEDYYLVESNGLRLDDNQALKFIFSNGNGFKVSRAYIKKINGDFVMVTGRGYLNKQIAKVSTTPSNAVAKAKALFDDGIKPADMNDLLIEA